MKGKKVLSAAELMLIKKLCLPTSFAPTSEERVIIEGFKRQGIVKVHGDGSIEVTDLGADRYVESRYGVMA